MMLKHDPQTPLTHPKLDARLYEYEKQYNS